MSEPAVEVINLSKKFNRRKDTERSIKSFILGNLFKKKQSFDFYALKDVNFTVEKGETLGIIGANGAGKSTLLSLIAGTTAPTKGKINVRGRMSTLLELGAGFHPDLTGRENVFLNASILGMSRRETAEKYQEIVELAGIGDAIDSPVKFYSSGMFVRLGFAVAVMCDPDILLMDEILAVGDEAFRKKSLSRIERFKVSGKTMIIISHDLETLKKMSDRLLLLDKGSVMDWGEPIEVVENYREIQIYQDGIVTVKEYGSLDVMIKNIVFRSNGSIIKDEIEPGVPLIIEMDLISAKKIENPVVGYGISDNLGATLFGTNTQIQNIRTGIVDGTKHITIEIPSLNLQRGIYFFSFAVHNESHTIQYHRIDNGFKVKILKHPVLPGIMLLPTNFIVGA